MSVRQKKMIVLVLLIVAVFTGLYRHRSHPTVYPTFTGPLPKMTLKADDRVMILAPHPDDEVLGCGGVIQQAQAMNLPVHIVFMTYGDSYEWSFIKYKKRLVLSPKGVEGMAEVRHREALAADTSLGVKPEDIDFLGYPDFGTLDMFCKSWGPDAAPIRGVLTRATAVPYPDAYRPGAAYRGNELLGDLTEIIRRFRPTRIFVSHSADHHPDHKSLYLFTRAALMGLENEVSPAVHPYLIHYTHWPAEQGFAPDEPLYPSGFLASRLMWELFPLNPPAVVKKREALKKHASQYMTTPQYLDSFVRTNELFGDFPVEVLEAESDSLKDGKTLTFENEWLEEDKAFLAGLVRQSFQIQDQTLKITIELNHPLAKEVGCSLYLLGFRDDCPFGQMPKIHIRLGEEKFELFDQTQLLDKKQIRVDRSGQMIYIYISLKAIGNPEQLFTSAVLFAGEIPLNWSAWRIFDMPPSSTVSDRAH